MLKLGSIQRLTKEREMFAVIRTGGKQYRVQEGDVLHIEKLDAEEGKKIFFDEVLLIEDGQNILIGTPLVNKARVKAEVIEHFKDNKVIIFKKKRRKQYKKKKGHRQPLTAVKIEEIISDIKAVAKKSKEAIKKEEEKGPIEKAKPKGKASLPEMKKRSSSKKVSQEEKKIKIKAQTKQPVETKTKVQQKASPAKRGQKKAAPSSLKTTKTKEKKDGS